MIFKRLVAASLSGSLFLSAAAASAAIDAYLTVKGQKQGAFPAELSTLPTGHIAVVDVAGLLATDVEAPRDAHTGLPTGKRQHKPITITKVLGSADPLLQQSLKTNEVFDDWTLVVSDTSNKGAVTTIKLKNAHVVGIRQLAPNEITATWVQGGKTYEQVQFSFERMDITRTGQASGVPASETQWWIIN